VGPADCEIDGSGVAVEGFGVNTVGDAVLVGPIDGKGDG